MHDPWQLLQESIRALKTDVTDLIDKYQQVAIKHATIEERLKNEINKRNEFREVAKWIVPTLIALASLVFTYFKTNK
jgi:hypothetical protein